MRLTRISDLTLLHANEPDRIGTVSDAILDIPERRVAYWQLDIGNRSGSAPVLVSARKSRLLDNTLRIDLPQDVLDSARSRGLSGQEDAADLQTLPDIITGPFGYTISPSMMGALFNAWRRRRRIERMPIPKGAPDGWLRASDLPGKPLFGSGGEIGSVTDAIVQGADSALTQLCISTRDGNDRTLPIGVLRHVPHGASHLVARVSVDGTVRPRPLHRPAAMA